MQILLYFFRSSVIIFYWTRVVLSSTPLKMMKSYFLILMTKLSWVAFIVKKQMGPFRWRECRLIGISKPFSEYPVYIQNQKDSNYHMVGFFEIPILLCFSKGNFCLIQSTCLVNASGFAMIISLLTGKFVWIH